MSNQKDMKFLVQFKENIKVKERMAVIKEKDKQMRHDLLLKRLAKKRDERLGKLSHPGGGATAPYITNQGVRISTVEIKNAN